MDQEENGCEHDLGVSSSSRSLVKLPESKQVRFRQQAGVGGQGTPGQVASPSRHLTLLSGWYKPLLVCYSGSPPQNPHGMRRPNPRRLRDFSRVT